MRRKLRILAAVILLVAAAWWAIAGANRSWTRTNEPIYSVDAITGLERTDWKSTFVPGVDFLGAAMAGSALLVLASFLFRKQTSRLPL